MHSSKHCFIQRARESWCLNNWETRLEVCCTYAACWFEIVGPTVANIQVVAESVLELSTLIPSHIHCRDKTILTAIFSAMSTAACKMIGLFLLNHALRTLQSVGPNLRENVLA